MSIEAMKQAHTALVEIYEGGLENFPVSLHNKAIDDLRTAIEQAEKREPVACVQDLDEVKRKHLVYEKGMDWKDPLYTTPPAAPVQEPVAYIRVSKTGHVMACAETGDFYALAHGTKLYTTLPAAPVQEPVIDHSCKDTYELIMKWADIYAAQTGELYSQAAQDPSKAARMADERTMLACVVAQAFPSPAAQRQWVGLTDEEKADLSEYDYPYDAVVATEAKLREKNGA